jgi:hypothetical protein
MGYMKHNAIIVTSWEEEKFLQAYNKATELFGEMVSNIVNGTINGYKSFFIPPDGSKEGWVESDYYDKLRSDFKNYIDTLAYEDGSNAVYCVEVFYDENGKKGVV